MEDIKVNDYPELRRRGAGIVNINKDEYFRAKARTKNFARIGNLEKEVVSLNQKLDQILAILSSK